MEGATILIQTALDLLAWTLLVKDRTVLSENGFEKLSAMDKLRRLGLACEVPLDIPASMVEISKLAKKHNWTDAPQALVEIRNALVHPNPKNRLRQAGLIAETRVLRECWRLGLWFLELVILKLVSYEGSYSNRLQQDVSGHHKAESVPWTRGTA